MLLFASLTGITYAPDAMADTYQCTVYPSKCTQPQAYAEAKAYANSVLAAYDPAKFEACVKASPKTYSAYIAGTGACHANGWTAGMKSFYYGATCAEQEDYTGTGPWSSGGSAQNGSLGCRNGCDGAWYSNSDGTKTWSATGDICPDDEKANCEKMGDGYYWNALLNVCEPPEGKCQDGRKPNSLGQCAPEPCPDGKVQQADGTCKNKSNECPAGQIKSPDGKCLPGDGQCAAGEVRGADGTCKKDKDGDGKPDEGEEGGEGPDGEKKDQFSGGDDCKSPPTCSGSPIMCGQARIQWRIDCNTRKNRNIAGGTCTSMPVCTGEKCDALEYSSLLMQWRTACATEKLAQNGTGNGSGQPAWTMVGGMSQDPGAGSSPSDTKVLTVKKIGVDDLDQSGFGGGGGCIGFIASGGSGIASGFAQSLASPPAYFCSYIGLIRAVLILSAAVTCAYILASGGKS